MNIYLGSVYPDALSDELLKRKQFVDYPANVFQHSLLKGLDSHIPNLQVISSPVIKSSCSVVKDICRGFGFSHTDSEQGNDVYVGTVPIPGIQLFAELKRVYQTLKRKLDKNRKNNRLIIYALHSPFLLAAILLRKRIGCACVIVLDLPEYMSSGNKIKQLLKKVDGVVINFCVKRLDCFVLLSPYMREKLPIANKPWALVEGIYDTSFIPSDINKNKERVVLYTGNLSRRYGIVELLDAFHQINNDNYRLWVCGRGEGAQDVMKMAEVDKRIKYLGIVSHAEVLSLQQRATILINPRSSSEEFTKYSFPSKTMEYLASGTPTVMCHLPAIPKEYDEYIFYIEDESVSGIKRTIEDVCGMTDGELFAFGKRAADFIRSKKNASVQAKKIIDLMDSIDCIYTE